MIHQSPTPQDPDTFADSDAYRAIETDTYFVINLRGSLFGFPVGNVEHIAPYQQPVSVPGTPTVFLGVIYLRSSIIPAVDLARMLCEGGAKDIATETAMQRDTRRYAVVRVAGQPFAVLADGVIGVRNVESASVHGVGSGDARAVTFNDVEISRGFCELLEGPATILCPDALHRVLSSMQE